MSVTSLRQPEYTGKNRCLPCTIVNIAIAAIVSILLTVVSTVLGAGIFVISLLIIYLRGYLVPGSPSLTKRYLPDRVLRWFGKEPTLSSSSDITTIDPERVLFDARAVALCENGSDLCLTDGFRSAWREQVRTVRERGDPTEADLRAVLDASSERISFEDYGKALLAGTDDDVVGQWPSPAARLTDIAAGKTLRERYSDWSAISPAGRARVLASLRIFIEACPQCGSLIHVDQESVESCCRSYDVLLLACQKCNATLFEIEWTEELSFVESNNQIDQSSSIEV